MAVKFPLINLRKTIDGQWDTSEVSQSITIPSSPDYIVHLDEVPDNGQIGGLIGIVGLTETTVYPPSTGQFYVNYSTGRIAFNSAQAGNSYTVTYYPKGSLVEAEDINYLNETMMVWKNIWSPTETYVKNEVVRDGDWTMVANTTTTERAAPQPNGERTFSILDEPFSTFSETAVVYTGNEYTLTLDGWIKTLRVWVPEVTDDTNYRFVVLNITDEDNPKSTVYEEGSSLTAGEWNIIDVGSAVFPIGTKLRCYVDAINSGSNTSITGGWRYDGDGDTEPGTGGWTRDKDKTVRINKTDLNLTDRTSELLGIVPDSTIRFAKTSDVSVYREYRVTSARINNSADVEYIVTLIDSNGTINTSDACTTDITIPIASSTGYSIATDYWNTPSNVPDWATVEGYLSVDGVHNPSVSGSAFGFDIEFQPASVSDDWDILATSDVGGGGDTGTDQFVYDSLDSLSASITGHIADYSETTHTDPNGFFHSGGLYMNSYPVTAQGIEGELYWDEQFHTLNIVTGLGNTVQVGQEMFGVGVNKTGDIIAADELRVVYQNDIDTNRMTFMYADAREWGKCFYIGATTAGFEINAEGPITTEGMVNNVNALNPRAGQGEPDWVEGDWLWVAADDTGIPTAIMPPAPNHTMFVGVVVKANANTGAVWIQPQHDFHQTASVAYGRLSSLSATVSGASTEGSVVFVGADGNYTEDNPNLFYDNTNNRLGIGTDNPIVPLQIGTTAGANGGDIYCFDLNGNPRFLFGDSSSNGEWGGLRWDSGSNHISLYHSTFGDTQMVLKSSGNVGIGLDDPDTPLEVNGTIKALSFYATASSNMSFTTTGDRSSGNNYHFYGGSTREMVDTDGRQAFMYLQPTIRQSGTAAYDGMYINITETTSGDGSTGSGNNIMSGDVNGTNMFKVGHDGSGYFASNVGIGTDTPTLGKLEVVQPDTASGLYIDITNSNVWRSAFTLRGSTMANFSYMTFSMGKNNNTYNNFSFVYQHSTDGNPGNSFYFQAGGYAPRLMSFKANGLCGIGTTTSTAQLEITNNDTGIITLKANAKAGQTSNILNVEVDDTVLSSFDANGRLNLDVNTQYGVNTGVNFGGDTSLYESASGTLRFAIGGVSKMAFTSNGLTGDNGARLKVNANASDTVPVFIPSSGDSGTGVGSAGTGKLSLIADSTESMRLSADGVTVPSLSASMPVWTDENNKLVSGIPTGSEPTIDIPLNLSMYDANPSRGSESNWNGGIEPLATGQPLDSVPTNIVVSKGTGKIIVVVNAGSDLVGTITLTGTTVDRNTGATTPADTDTMILDALTSDASTTDSNGNTKHTFTGAYITSKWFTGSVTLSTADLTLTDVDVYHVSFEQFNDSPGITLDSFDANIYTTNAAAEFDAYLYSLHVTTGDKCNIELEAELHVGADGETALVDKYFRLRKGNLNDPIDGTKDGIWTDIHYSNSPAYIEDVTVKIWATKTITVS